MSTQRDVFDELENIIDLHNGPSPISPVTEMAADIEDISLGDSDAEAVSEFSHTERQQPPTALSSNDTGHLWTGKKTKQRNKDSSGAKRARVLYKEQENIPLGLNHALVDDNDGSSWQPAHDIKALPVQPPQGGGLSRRRCSSSGFSDVQDVATVNTELLSLTNNPFRANAEGIECHQLKGPKHHTFDNDDIVPKTFEDADRMSGGHDSGNIVQYNEISDRDLQIVDSSLERQSPFHYPAAAFVEYDYDKSTEQRSDHANLSFIDESGNRCFPAMYKDCDEASETADQTCDYSQDDDSYEASGYESSDIDDDRVDDESNDVDSESEPSGASGDDNDDEGADETLNFDGMQLALRDDPQWSVPQWRSAEQVQQVFPFMRGCVDTALQRLRDDHDPAYWYDHRAEVGTPFLDKTISFTEGEREGGFELYVRIRYEHQTNTLLNPSLTAARNLKLKHRCNALDNDPVFCIIRVCEKRADHRASRHRPRRLSSHVYDEDTVVARSCVLDLTVYNAEVISSYFAQDGATKGFNIGEDNSDMLMDWLVPAEGQDRRYVANFDFYTVADYANRPATEAEVDMLLDSDDGAIPLGFVTVGQIFRRGTSSFRQSWPERKKKLRTTNVRLPECIQSVGSKVEDQLRMLFPDSRLTPRLIVQNFPCNLDDLERLCGARLRDAFTEEERKFIYPLFLEEVVMKIRPDPRSPLQPIHLSQIVEDCHDICASVPSRPDDLIANL